MSRTIRPAMHDDTVQELGSASYLRKGGFRGAGYYWVSRIRILEGLRFSRLGGESFGAP